MLSFSSQQRYFIYPQACDMRKGFNGLGGLVNQYFDHPLLSGDIFIFMNRRRTHLKLLMWDVTGFAIYYKRLEAGTYEMPSLTSETMLAFQKNQVHKKDNEDGAEDSTEKLLPKAIEIKWSQLVLLLEGIEMKSIKKRKRFVGK